MELPAPLLNARQRRLDLEREYADLLARLQERALMCRPPEPEPKPQPEPEPKPQPEPEPPVVEPPVNG